MTRPKRKLVKRSYTKSYYQLSEVIQKINDGQVIIRRNALEDAYNQFGWESPDILSAYKKLKNPLHFHKTDASRYIPGVAIDIYKATINGESIYTHFYIDDTSNKLIINSFKEQSYLIRGAK